MELISDEYCRLNAEMHEKIPDYGVQGREHFIDIDTMAKSMGTNDILDYGCGKGTLAMHFPFTIQQYDPAIPKHSEMPEPADIVVCTDVMEHIEPDKLENVLNHLKSLTKKLFYSTICTELAVKKLPDGRNAHLIVQSPAWWFCKLEEYFEVINYRRADNHILAVCIPR